ncbi:hypothetical protein EB796_024264 [Bugula neritina]|uniref:Uncharacterized protein n=1 Tax=Bugula neritina TaxID=10212 RepID=A0A7J7IW20_BUGNE|nr:hypothetical protein EB796_024264 [Bugula neritina]
MSFQLESGSKEKLVYALSDTKSDACFISKETAHPIKPNGQPECFTIFTLNGSLTKKTKIFTHIKLRGFLTNHVIYTNEYEEELISCNQMSQVIGCIATSKVRSELNRLSDESAKLEYYKGLLAAAGLLPSSPFARRDLAAERHKRVCT